MSATAAWPRCGRCPDTPAKWHVRGGRTAAMAEVRANACDRHVAVAQKETRGFDYRETRPCAPGDGATAQAEVEQGSLFDLGGDA